MIQTVNSLSALLDGSTADYHQVNLQVTSSEYHLKKCVIIIAMIFPSLSLVILLPDSIIQFLQCEPIF